MKLVYEDVRLYHPDFRRLGNSDGVEFACSRRLSKTKTNVGRAVAFVTRPLSQAGNRGGHFRLVCLEEKKKEL